MTTYVYASTFDSPFDDCGGVLCSELKGKPFQVQRVIDTPDETHDAEVLPMFVVTIEGREIEAWPEEVLTSRW